MGSISVNVWAIACACVVSLISEGVRAVWTLASGGVKGGPQRDEKIAMEGATTEPKQNKTGDYREKKEL